MPQRRRRMRHPQPDLGGQLLGLGVEHHERRQPARPVRADQAADLRVAEQVVADVLDRLELGRTPVGRHEDIRMPAVERVVVADVAEAAHPPVDAEQVERCRRDEVDRALVGAEELAQVGNSAESGWSGHRGSLLGAELCPRATPPRPQPLLPETQVDAVRGSQRAQALA